MRLTETVKCLFCSKDNNAVTKMFASTEPCVIAHICIECVDFAQSVARGMSAPTVPKGEPPRLDRNWLKIIGVDREYRLLQMAFYEKEVTFAIEDNNLAIVDLRAQLLESKELYYYNELTVGPNNPVVRYTFENVLINHAHNSHIYTITLKKAVRQQTNEGFINVPKV